MESEKKFVQLVMNEMAGLISDADQIRVAFSPGTDSHRMISTLAAQKGVDPRKIIEAAIRTFYVAWMIGAKNE